MSIDHVIEVKNVWKSFRTVQAVRGIDLKIPKGQFIAILGPNGAGKTTLVEMIEGIRKYCLCGFSLFDLIPYIQHRGR